MSGAPDVPTTTPVSREVDNAAAALLIGVSGAVVAQWKKLGGWVIAAFAAALGLILSNYQRIVDITSAATVHAFLWLFVAAAVLHLGQRLAIGLVNAGVSGGEAGAKIKLGAADLPQVFRLVADAYCWPMKSWVKATMQRSLDGDSTHIGRILLRTALVAALLGLLQLVLAIVAIVCVGWTLHLPAA